MKVIINGANGRMGRMLTACIEESADFTIAARVSRSFTLCPEAGIYQTLEQFEGEADCVIDFSNHVETGSLLGYCVMRGLPVVIATTGQSAEELQQIEYAAKSIPVFLSANMSLGGKGVISVLSNILPKETHEICQLCLDNDFKTAGELQIKYLELINALFCEVNPIPVKAGMAAMGWCENYLRLPLTPMEDAHWQALRALMAARGLL